jgi:hypothetical protein
MAPKALISFSATCGFSVPQLSCHPLGGIDKILYSRRLELMTYDSLQERKTLSN